MKYSVFLFSSVLLFSTKALSAEDTGVGSKSNLTESRKIETKSELSGRELGVALEALVLEIDPENSIQTVGMGFNFSEPLSEKISFNLAFSQGYSDGDSYTALYYGSRLSASYSLLGFLNREKKTILVEGVPKLVTENADAGQNSQIVLEGGLSQYFFNTGVQSLSFSGANFFCYYQRPVFGLKTALGVGLERLSSGGLVILPLRAFLRFSVPLSGF